MRRNLISRLGLVLGASLIVSCSDGVGPTAGPFSMVPASDDNQSAEVGTAVAAPPAVLVVDARGNPVPGTAVSFRVVAGGGSVEGQSRQTDAAGIAMAGTWILGPEPGTNLVEATVEGLYPVTFTAEATAGPGFNLFIEAVHLNQGNQTPDGKIGGIAGRPGLLRVVVRANQPNEYSPEVRLRLFQDDHLLREVVLSASGNGVPVYPDLNTFEETWNLALTRDEVVTGLAVEAEVDPDQTIPVSTRADNRYPAVEGAASLDVQPLPPWNVVFLPIHLTVRDETGRVHADNTSEFLESPSQWIPSAEISTKVRETFSTDLPIPDHDAWMTLISDVRALRTADGATDEYYVGVVRRFSGMRYRGLAYRLTDPASDARVSLVHDDLPEASSTLAHELGHNLGRMHAPCGDPSNVDPDYPHLGGAIGHPGWDMLSNTLVHSDYNFDYMSPCRPRWTSDYTFGGILDWRRSDPLAAQPGWAGEVLESDAPTSGLLLWGRITQAGVFLNPAFAFQSRPILPPVGGPNQLKGYSADGRELFNISFEGNQVMCVTCPSERHFAFFVPLSNPDIDSLVRVEALTPVGTAAMASPAVDPDTVGRPTPRPTVSVETLPGRRLRFDWTESDRYNAALIKHRDTGRVLAIARDGTSVTSGVALQPSDVLVIVSDGVRSHAVIPE